MSVKQKQGGFTLVEILIALIIFPIVVIGIANAFDTVRKSYRVSRQLNEMYAVLSACPELDRALDYAILTSGTNCYPNNTFTAEGASGKTITYSPTLTVSQTSNLSNGDPLKSIPDSKVVQVNTGYTIDSAGTPLSLKLVVTRGGVAQQ
jgi:prepilin-type N-terminal cleavage/methylation domain-containing protein